MINDAVQLVLTCPLCGGVGRELYSGLRDVFYENEGSFASRQCASCGFIWLSPRPSPEDMSRFYAVYFTHAPVNLPPVRTGGKRFLGAFRDMLRESIICGYYGYRRTRPDWCFERLGAWLGWFPLLRERAAGLFPALPVCRMGGRILDVGCGNGDFLFFLGQLGWDVRGVETDRLAAETARRRGIPVEDGPVEKSGLPEYWADVITMNHVIEHLYDFVSALKECRRILKPDGRLCLYTPNASSLGHGMFGKAWRALDPPRHLQIFSPATIRAVLSSAGFSDIRVRTSARNAAGVYDASAAIADEGHLRGREVARHKGASAFALKEALMCSLGFYKGEELVVTAHK